MVEELPIGTGAHGFIRGCWSGVYLNGFNRSTTPVAALRQHTFCEAFNASQLPSSLGHSTGGGGGRGSGGGRAAASGGDFGGGSFDSKMRVCSCSGNLCNGQEFSSTTSSRHTTLDSGVLMLMMRTGALSFSITTAAVAYTLQRLLLSTPQMV